MPVNRPGAVSRSGAWGGDEPAERTPARLHAPTGRPQRASGATAAAGCRAGVRVRAVGTPMHGLLFPALVLAAVGLATHAAPSRPQATGERNCGFVGAWSARVLGGQPSAGALRAPAAGGPRWPGVCAHRQRLPRALLPCIPRGVLGLSAQFQTGEEQQVTAQWRPPPLSGAYSDVDGTDASPDDLTPSDSSSDEDGDDGGSGDAASAGVAAEDPRASTAPVVVGAGALRGEQEEYSMRDVQSMKVPRLRAMCEVRTLTQPADAHTLLRTWRADARRHACPGRPAHREQAPRGACRAPLRGFWV